MNKFNEQEINQILNLTKGFLNQTIDVFNLTAALFIGNDKTQGEWDSSILFSENRVHITLADFKDCQTEEDVKNV